ncbi:MAG TPA: DUF4012 domain-containing protein [Actinomycetota bacterium]|nr:DUF4012 domain-containing protein [Actinomycetota bacterium]
MSTAGLVAHPPLSRPRLGRGLRAVAVLIVLDLVWASVSVGVSLHAASDSLRRLSRASAAADPHGLETALQDAAASARSARLSLERHPSLMLLRAAGLGSDHAAVAGLARVAEEAAGIGLSLLARLESLSERQALISEGRLLDTGIDALLVEVAAAGERLEDLASYLRTAESSRFGWLDSAMTGARREVEAAVELGRRFDRLLSILPGLTGYLGERRYLLALQSPSEARGGGGLIGLYGILHVDAGRIRLGRVGSARELNRGLDAPVAAPRWFEELYGSLGAQKDIRLANLSPSFPAVARVLLNMYEAGTEQRLDGVMAIDPIAFGKLTKATGPLQAPGWDVRVSSVNARRILLKEIYVRFGRWRSKAQNTYLEALVRKLWSRLLSEKVAVSGLGVAWADAAATQHFKIYSEDLREQQSLAELGIAGDLRTFGSRLQMVWHNNWSGTKVDHYFRRRLETRISLQPSGSADIATTISLRNRSPADADLLGRAKGVNDLPPGLNRMTLSVAAPIGARSVVMSLDGRAVDARSGTESGYPVFWIPVDVPARAETEVSIRYSVPDFFTIGAFSEMTFHPQVMERPDLMEVTIAPPEGYAIEGLDRASPTGDGAWRAARLLKGPATLRWKVVAR